MDQAAVLTILCSGMDQLYPEALLCAAQVATDTTNKSLLYCPLASMGLPYDSLVCLILPLCTLDPYVPPLMGIP